MIVSDYIAEFLHSKGVRQVFELSGGMITHLLDSLHRAGNISIISVHHEQAAAFAADGSGRMTGIPGVAMATSGPGATNLLTGIGSCYFDSTPAVFITGQVNRHEQKGTRHIRQLGFQETDVVSMAIPITKKSWRVENPEQIPAILEDAFAMAVHGRPGPVLIDIPMDVQRIHIDPHQAAHSKPSHGSPLLPESDICENLARALATAERPLILAGGGLRSARVVEEFRTLVDVSGVPVVCSLMGVDTLPYSHPLRVGMIGSYGNRWANLTLHQCDLLLVLGSRLDVRQTGSDTQGFKGTKTIYHVDCESGEMNNRVKDCHAVRAELKDFLPRMTKALKRIGTLSSTLQVWRNEISALRATWPDTNELDTGSGINPNVFMHDLSRASSAATAFVVDVGQHQMWAAQSAELLSHHRLLTSGGMGSMGFALPASLGVSLSAPGEPVVVIAGDGGFQCNIQELQTVVRLNLPIKIVIVNNKCHGMVRQFQETYFGQRYPSSLWGYSAPDFARVAEAYGIAAKTIVKPSEVPESLDWLWRNPSEPNLLQVMVETEVNVYPKLAFGRPISEMEPHSAPVAMEST